ncbi:MAG: hypothetical protein J6C07_09680 [Lachnospiraceae bacterium]|nr:hypothetical protein [Lachnospiraceae bacterium]
MVIFLIIIFVLLLIFIPNILICSISNFPSVIYYAVKDTVAYFKYKKSRLVRTGEIVGFLGLFGRGKTLSVIHYVCSIYRAKNGLRVYCPRRKKWVTQRVNIISNVHINDIPYENLVSLEQVVLSTDTVRDYDDEHDTLTVTLVVIDEAGSELNSRAFRSNIDPLLLNSILTCRHWNISIFYTAQRFGHVDALMRQVTSYVLSCEKVWRFQIQKKYDAWELEQASSPALVACKAILCWFVKDKDYKAYDTYECVDKLKKDMKEGQMMSAEEILALRVNPESSNMDGVMNYSKKYLKAKKKTNRKLF